MSNDNKILSVAKSGLSEMEAQRRLQSEGYNELPRQDRRTPLRIVLEVFREPMFALLLGGGFTYLLLGDLKEALILLAFAILSVAITVIQETRTERVLEALRDLTSPRALVIRDGTRRRIAGREVARGDLIVLGEGDRVPADAVLMQARDLQADESLLTGESVPVRKTAATGAVATSRARPGGDDLPFVYSGTLVVRGSGLAYAVATGASSEIGKIGQSLNRLEAEPPRLQVQTARLVRLAALGGAAISIVAVVLKARPMAALFSKIQVLSLLPCRSECHGGYGIKTAKPPTTREPAAVPLFLCLACRGQPSLQSRPDARKVGAGLIRIAATH